MRIALNDRFWVVMDPRPASELADVYFETTLAGLERQFSSGLTAADNPTLFTDREKAEREARSRLGQGR